MPGYGTAMRRYFEFSGRSSRSEFWLFTLVSNLLMGGGAQLLDIVAGTDHRFFILVSLIHLIPSLAVSARRLHDTDRSGWLYLLLLTLVGAVPLLVFYCQRGTSGPNRYGLPFGEESFAGGSYTLPGAPPRTAPLGADALVEIERLAALRLSGALTEAEFASMKARILNRTPGSRIEPSF